MNEPGKTAENGDLPPGVTVGRHTYGHSRETFRLFMVDARIEVGAFCSIGPDVRVLAGSEHRTARATTFPLNALLFDPRGGNVGDAIDRGTTVIGNDVWIGLGATILSGVTIGDGAVLGAQAVVSKSVPPYAVVVGNPARIARFRFAPAIRRRLLELRWWDWADEQIVALKTSFMGDVEAFLDDAERTVGARSSPGRSGRTAAAESGCGCSETRGRGGEDREAFEGLEIASRIRAIERRIAELEALAATSSSPPVERVAESRKIRADGLRGLLPWRRGARRR